MKITIFQPWSEFVMKGVLPEELISELIELTDIINHNPQKESSNSTLAGEIKNEWVIDTPLLGNIRFQSFLFELLDEYLKVVKNRNINPIYQNTPNDISLPINQVVLQLKDWIIQSAWFIDQKDNEYNPIHSHGGILSGVLYLKIPEYLPPRKNKNTDGTITFIGNTSQNDGLFTIPHFSVSPKVGDIFIFPSTQRHHVYPFRSVDGKEIRRSLSFNVSASELMEFVSV